MNKILVKAYGRKDIGKLVPKVIVDKNGKRMKVYVKPEGKNYMNRVREEAYDTIDKLMIEARNGSYKAKKALKSIFEDSWENIEQKYENSGGVFTGWLEVGVDRYLEMRHEGSLEIKSKNKLPYLI